ncbi:hypothetical protein [Prosthecochloris sp. HL-130-GSB]|uniref:hypothetical protein n=1 Tax=Prosthecochloris sp. HL-130-GSB TaxID=1974213 RepID=UPI0012F4C4E1|nr:hypothetical protein [Prosthecochloris sp. HL-130-GSB]
MRLKTLSITLALLYGLVLTGCTSSLRNTQLERVTGRWWSGQARLFLSILSVKICNPVISFWSAHLSKSR